MSITVTSDGRTIDPIYGPQWCQSDCPDCPDKPGPCHWTCGSSVDLREAQRVWRARHVDGLEGVSDGAQAVEPQ